MTFCRRSILAFFLIGCFVLFQGCIEKDISHETSETDLFEDCENEVQQNNDKNIYFYVTPHGEKYHYSDCSYIRRDLSECRMYTEVQAEKRGYEPCSRCIG